jgi:uncharacterized membrane protein YsdA (DUF1294 family)
MKYYHLLIISLGAFLGASYYLGYTPIALIVIFLLSSMITYYLYARDKSAARAGLWRVSENTLHTAGLMFGWPGAFIAQRRLRHKTKKRSFRTVFWLSVIVNLCAVGWLHSPKGNMRFREAVHQVERFVTASMPYENPRSIIRFLVKFRNRGVGWLG